MVISNLKTVVVINSNGMGIGNTALTHKLVNTYLNMLDLGDILPKAICFYAEGVKLACDGSPVLDELHSLADKGVQLIICTTCLNHYKILDELQVGTAGGMKDIVEAQWDADKVITI